jgi:mannose-6-phosphate isomerase-like protein (cupin superfamily)
MRRMPVIGAALGVALLAVTFVPAPPGGEAPPPAAPKRLATKVLRRDEATASRDAWGEFRRYFDGEGATAKDLLAGVAAVKPGQALHEAHRHAEEEFLYIVEGSGTWSVEGKDLPLKKGDVLYVEPWAMHGCRNTGQEEMVFFVARWLGKGVPRPPEPTDGLPHEKGR